MKKVTSNKLDELCYRAYITKEFQKDLPALRSKYGIPVNGFNTEGRYKKWLNKNTDQKNKTLFERCAWLSQRYNLPPDAELRLKEYILFGTSDLRPESLDVWMPLDELSVCDIELLNKPSKRWTNTNIPTVKIIISDHASQNDVTKYIRSHWKIIQHLLNSRRNGDKKQLVRPVHDRELQERILSLNKLKISELRKLAPNGIYQYKENVIAAIINKDSKKQITAENIKQIITRRNKFGKR